MNNKIKKITSIWKKMFKKINIITNITVGLILAPITFYYSQNATALALAGMVAMAWFIIILCKPAKNPGVEK